MSSDQLTYFASSPRHLESLLSKELTALGGTHVREVSSGVQFTGDLEMAYRACLWTRVANRVLYPLGEGTAKSPEALYSLIRSFDWAEHLTSEQTLAVDFFCAKSQITHSQYGALKVKDAIVDQFREKFGTRPSVDRLTPDVRINVYLFRDRARVAIDLSGASLHRRGYRQGGDRAPLKENLAASLLLAMDWAELSSAGKSFYDPMCGSGTLLIEAAMIASNTAPGILREYYGFLGWRQHQADVWERVLGDAQVAAENGRTNMPLILGSDKSQQAVDIAIENVDAAGFNGLIEITCSDITRLNLPDTVPKGLLVANPPYGIRVEEQARLGQLYTDIGTELSRGFRGWQVALFSGAPKLLFRTRLDLTTVLEVDNGGIPCKLVSARLGNNKKTSDENPESALVTQEQHTDDSRPKGRVKIQTEPESSSDAASVWAVAAKRRSNKADFGEEPELPVAKSAPPQLDQSADNMFANRLRKNLRGLRSWIKREMVVAYRVYDADMPEYAVAVDLYDVTLNEKKSRHIVVQEYQAPSRVDETKAAERLALVMKTIPEVFQCPADHVHLKVRRRQKGREQYVRTASNQREFVVQEYGCKLLVNFDDYLDTGVFLDHRKVRHFIQQESKGCRFLNLFGYTGAATVHAIRGGAANSMTIDMSNTYLDWAKRNLALNDGNDVQHTLLRADCTEWLAQLGGEREPYDLILLDPPTFSNSARMEKDWDVQRDHAELIRQAMALLAPRGLLIFSNNFRRFRLDQAVLSDFVLEDRTAWSIDQDFQRNQRIHHCWFIRHA